MIDNRKTELVAECQLVILLQFMPVRSRDTLRILTCYDWYGGHFLYWTCSVSAVREMVLLHSIISFCKFLLRPDLSSVQIVK